MSTLRSIIEWLAFGLLRLAGTCEAAGGLAFLAAAGAVQATGATAPWVRLVSTGAFALAVVLLTAGIISLYLGRARLAWLPDGPRSQQSTGSGFDGWLVLFPLTVIATTALMLARLRPLVEFWRDVFALADRLNFWESLQKNSADAGYILMPVFSALALPGLDAAAAVAAVVGSAFLIALLLVRSTRAPRALLLYVILQAALVVAGTIGAVIVDRLMPEIEQLVRSTPDPGGVEVPRIMAVLERYGAVARGSSATLAWSWGAIALWLPVLLLSGLGRSAFSAAASSDQPTPGGVSSPAPNYAAMDDQARKRAYLDAAQEVDRSTRPSYSIFK